MKIGDFARLGQVSVRMLRHYDHIGLFVPTKVDESTGYRTYDPEQLEDLHRIVALKDLGFTLVEVGRILAESVSADELRGMLRLRRVQLTDEARAAGIRLAAVESRLRMIEQERKPMKNDYVTKTVREVRLAAVTAVLNPDELGEHIGPMFDRVRDVIQPLGASLATPIATYAETEDGMSVVVGYEFRGECPEGLQIVELPEQPAVCGVHLGPMRSIHESWMELHRWLVGSGHHYNGPCRELYVRAESDDQHDWVTELQQPVISRP